jgi:myoneurin
VIESNLLKHMKVHSSQAYTCSSCGKNFYDELSLAAHFNLHRGETAFKCGFCGKEFLRSGSNFTFMANFVAKLYAGI